VKLKAEGMHFVFCVDRKPHNCDSGTCECLFEEFQDELNLQLYYCCKSLMGTVCVNQIFVIFVLQRSSFMFL
jgi:hypothetical protein